MNAVVLAGGPPDAVAATVPGTPNKAFVPIGGVALVERVIAALRDSNAFERIVVVAPEAAHVRPALAGADERRPDGARMIESLASGVAGLDPDESVLVAASDLPLLSTRAIAEFLAAAGARDLDLAYAVVEKRDHLAAYPSVPHTWAKLQGNRFCGGGVGRAQAARRPGVTDRARRSRRRAQIAVAACRPLRLGHSAALCARNVECRDGRTAGERDFASAGRRDPLPVSGNRGERGSGNRYRARKRLGRRDGEAVSMILVDERRLAFGIDPALLRHAAGESDGVLSPAAFLARGTGRRVVREGERRAIVRRIAATRDGLGIPAHVRRSASFAVRVLEAIDREDETAFAALTAAYNDVLTAAKAGDAAAGLRRVLGAGTFSAGEAVIAIDAALLAGDAAFAWRRLAALGEFALEPVELGSVAAPALDLLGVESVTAFFRYAASEKDADARAALRSKLAPVEPDDARTLLAIAGDAANVLDVIETGSIGGGREFAHALRTVARAYRIPDAGALDVLNVAATVLAIEPATRAALERIASDFDAARAFAPVWEAADFIAEIDAELTGCTQIAGNFPAFPAPAVVPEPNVPVTSRRATFSASSLNAFAECERKWFYRYVCAAVEDRGSSASFYGIAFHAALEEFHGKHARFDNVDAAALASFLDYCIVTSFDRHRTRFDAPVEFELQKRRARRTAKRYLSWLLERARRAPFEVIGCETSTDVELGGFRFIGYIDRLDRDDGTGAVTVVDYKTGAIAKSAGEYLDDLLAFAEFQLPFYYWGTHRRRRPRDASFARTAQRRAARRRADRTDGGRAAAAAARTAPQGHDGGNRRSRPRARARKDDRDRRQPCGAHDRALRGRDRSRRVPLLFVQRFVPRPAAGGRRTIRPMIRAVETPDPQIVALPATSALILISGPVASGKSTALAQRYVALLAATNAAPEATVIASSHPDGARALRDRIAAQSGDAVRAALAAAPFAGITLDTLALAIVADGAIAAGLAPDLELLEPEEIEGNLRACGRAAVLRGVGRISRRRHRSRNQRSAGARPFRRSRAAPRREIARCGDRPGDDARTSVARRQHVLRQAAEFRRARLAARNKRRTSQFAAR